MTRYGVVAALFVLSMITYIDRAAISTAKGPIAKELALSDHAMGMVFGAFALGYALAQIPAGLFADRFGPRFALAAFVTIWSLLTALTGAVTGFASMIAVRFLFGVAEAGAFPGSTRAIVNWLPVTERGRANGVLFSGSRIGAAIAFPLLVYMLGTWTWRISFVILGGIGLCWALFWLLRFRDHPAVAPAAPMSTAGDPIRLRDVLTSTRMLPVMFQYFAGNFTFFICISWIHPYLKSRYSLDDATAATYTMIPLLVAASSQWITGALVDGLYRSAWRPWSRRLPAIFGFCLSAVAILAVASADTPGMAATFFTLATFGVEMTISPSWTYCADIAGKNSGSVSASMNMIGNLGSFISANAFPYLYGMTGSATAYFGVAALLNAGAAICWLRMKPEGQVH